MAAVDMRSAAELLPGIDFAFNDLRKRMAQFTARFDKFIDTGRQQVLEEKNHFRVALAEYQEDKRFTTRSVEIETDKSHVYTDHLAKETIEKTEMHAQIASLSAHQRAVAEQNATLSAELQSTQSTLSARRDAQVKHLRYLSSQSRHNEPELAFWEDHLCMKIGGLGVEDRLRFVFSHLVEKDWDGEACFELDTSSRDYRVSSTTPRLDSADVEELLNTLNESRELGTFFKGMRDAFLRVMK